MIYSSSGNFLGVNVVALLNSGGKRYGSILLGTFDTEEDAKNEIKEIYNAMKAGQRAYTVTFPADDLEDLEVE